MTNDWHAVRTSMRFFRLHVAWVLTMGTLLIYGCNSSDGRRLVQGSVTFNGEPLAQGQIVFEPRGTGRMSVAQIDAGRYRLPDGFGLTEGQYVVRITSDRPTGRKIQPAAYSEDQTPTEIYEQFLPNKYNRDSELLIELTNDSETTFDFDLSTN